MKRRLVWAVICSMFIIGLSFVMGQAQAEMMRPGGRKG